MESKFPSDDSTATIRSNRGWARELNFIRRASTGFSEWGHFRASGNDAIDTIRDRIMQSRFSMMNASAFGMRLLLQSLEDYNAWYSSRTRYGD